MTFLEKAMEINKTEGGTQTASAIIRRNCPYDYGLEESDVCNRVGEEKCFDCWNREMPNTELVKTVTLPMPPNTDKPFTEKEVYEEAGYNKGLNDAWKLAEKIWSGKDNENVEIFGTKFVYEIYQLSPQEVLAKLKAYKEAQNEIKVGDVVTYAGERCLVLDTKGDRVVVLTSDCCILEWHKCDVEKTGKHIELDRLLEQIGE